ncbi:hypothetical protein FACS189472_11990 [Alphaproteobacteria bacterium]|nr:hypothetical protein FACS189472_11990 [Alphaproteobacteria bacterium]
MSAFGTGGKSGETEKLSTGEEKRFDRPSMRVDTVLQPGFAEAEEASAEEEEAVRAEGSG